jgi:Lon protease-like protein
LELMTDRQPDDLPAGVPMPMPMFPLGTVLFPYALLPLHVFEPRYRLMVQHVMEGDREFGVVLIERGSEVGGGDTRFDVATVARIVQASELPDGRFALATVGIRRVQVRRWLDDDPYPRAEVVNLDEPPVSGPRGEGDDRDIEAILANARDRVVAGMAVVTELARHLDPRVTEAPVLDADPVRASYEAAAIAPIGPLDAQRVLATPDAKSRLELLAVLLADCTVDLRARFGLDE